MVLPPIVVISFFLCIHTTMQIEIQNHPIALEMLKCQRYVCRIKCTQSIVLSHLKLF